MANSTSGIYGGFSYLNSPTDKTALPKSPRLSARSEGSRQGTNPIDSQQEEEEQKQPFSYLAPHSPLETTASQSPPVFDDRETYDNNPRLPRDPAFSTLPTQHNHRIASDPTYYTSARDFNSKTTDNGRVVGELYNNRLIDDNDKRSAYIVPDYPSNDTRGGNENFGYELSPTDRSGQIIPRPKYSASKITAANKEHDRRYENVYESATYADQQNAFSSDYEKGRPLSRDSYLDSAHRKNNNVCNRCCMVLAIILLVILALGAGFAAGWFVSQEVNEDAGSGLHGSDVPGTPSTAGGGDLTSTTAVPTVTTSRSITTTLQAPSSTVMSTTTVSTTPDSTTTSSATSTTTSSALNSTSQL